MVTMHRFPYTNRVGDTMTRSDPDRALNAERAGWDLAWSAMAQQCAAVRELRVVPHLFSSEHDPRGVWAPATFEHRPVYLREVIAACPDAACAHATPEGRVRARKAAWEAASPVLRHLRRAAGVRRAKRARRASGGAVVGFGVVPGSVRYLTVPWTHVGGAVRALAGGDRFRDGVR